ncbi:MAG TPA: hypothetical protein VJJ75_03630 [Candidatus Nanoarchaeia archaeon]|nr:hypothetical protein [Candidatus Nanoarchaeia archaeon]
MDVMEWWKTLRREPRHFSCKDMRMTTIEQITSMQLCNLPINEVKHENL